MTGELKHRLISPFSVTEAGTSVMSEDGLEMDIEYATSTNGTECVAIKPVGIEKVQDGLGQYVIKAITVLPPHLFVKLELDPFAADGSHGTVQFTEPAQ
jgi:hypothetical protein